MSRRKWSGLTGIVIIPAVILTGCASPQGEPSTLPKAKAIALKMENEIVRLVPSANVKNLQQEEKAPLLSCQKSLYTWTGQTTVTMTGEPDPREILDRIAAAMKRRYGYAVKKSVAPDGESMIQIIAPDRGNYLVGFWSKDTILRVDSNSLCFTMDPAKSGGVL